MRPLLAPAALGDALLRPVRCERRAATLVWGVWLAMLLFALSCLVRYGRNIPLAEDWTMVAALTGNEPNLLAWLWSQNQEHRIPLPRWLLLALLELTHGDFRVGALFNILALGGLSLALIRVSAALRGRISVADAFFPLALLHVGNWENLFWSWQLSFVLPIVLTLGILLLSLCDPTFARPGPGLAAGTALVLLPLCGAPGLAVTPPLALWLGASGLLRYRAGRCSEARWLGAFLLGSAVLALALIGLYFVGYVRPYWNPPSPGLRASLWTAGLLLANGFGPVARESWSSFTWAALAFLLPATGLALLAAWRQRAADRRAVALVLFFGGLAALALSFGWGRAALVPTTGLPNRYVLLAVPAFCAAFLAWGLYGPTGLGRAAQYAALLAMLLLLPLNTAIGFGWGNWYRQGMDAVARDLEAGAPSQVLAQRHLKMLVHWWPEDQLAAHIRMLRDARIGPFSQLQEPANP